MNFDISKLQGATGLNPNIQNIGDIITIILPYIFGIAGLALLFMIIFGGFQFLTSGGDPKATQTAQTRITNALIGFIIIFVAYWLVQLIGKILGIEIIKNIFGE